MSGKEGAMDVLGMHAVGLLFMHSRLFSSLLLSMYTFKECNVIREKNNLKILPVNFVSVIF